MGKSCFKNCHLDGLISMMLKNRLKALPAEVLFLLPFQEPYSPCIAICGPVTLMILTEMNSVALN